jgi:DNA end-binding protein Ku
VPQSVWVGDLSFGLVNIPIRLYAATSPRRVRFHQYEAGTGRRIRYRRVAEGAAPEEPLPQSRDDVSRPVPLDVVPEPPADPGPTQAAGSPPDADAEPEVPWEDIVRGYEVEPGRVVTVEPEELDSVAPERSRSIEIEQFVELGDIDPVFFEKSYYVVPQPGPIPERPYWLLYRAMDKGGRVAVGRFVLRTKEYLAIVRPAEHVLMLETLFYPDEVRDPKEVWYPTIVEPEERELRTAEVLLDALSARWEPARHRDEHRERLLELIRSKAGEAVTVSDSEEETPIAPVVDLMEALRASVDAARQAREAGPRRSG